MNYSKIRLKWPLQRDKTEILMTNGSLMMITSIAECSHSALLLACIKRYLVLNTSFCQSDRFTQGLPYY